MAYGAQFFNSSGNIIIDTAWPNPQVVETTTYNTVARGSTYPTAGILSTDIVIARPIRTTQSTALVMKTAQSRNGGTSLIWSSPYTVVGPTTPSYAYYRLREGAGTTSGYGLVVYEDDGVTPTFSSNGVDIHYEVAAYFSASLSYNATWFDIPSGDDINDYFCVISGLKTVHYYDGFIGDLIFHSGYLYDYTNNRIQAVGFENGATYRQGNGIIGKILK